MKKIIFLGLITLSFSAISSQKCYPPQGKYTDLEMVLNQFVLMNGNPNWGDWCYEEPSGHDQKECTDELDAWDEWLKCSGLTSI